MIEFRAFGVETDRPIPGAVARVNDLEMVEAISVLEDQRGLFGHDQDIEGPEEIEIVPVDKKLGRGHDRTASGGEPAARMSLEFERLKRDAATDRSAAKAEDARWSLRG
jgi:hypothetical protein